MISVLSFGYLYWSSSRRWQAHIRGCKLLRPLLRAEMGDFGSIFREIYFLWVWWTSTQKNLVQIFRVLPPKTFFPAPAEGTYLLQINIKIKLAISPNPQISACHFAVIEVQKKTCDFVRSFYPRLMGCCSHCKTINEKGQFSFCSVTSKVQSGGTWIKLLSKESFKTLCFDSCKSGWCSKDEQMLWLCETGWL